MTKINCFAVKYLAIYLFLQFIYMSNRHYQLFDVAEAAESQVTKYSTDGHVIGWLLVTYLTAGCMGCMRCC